MTAGTSIITYLIKQVQEAYVISLRVLQIAFNLGKKKYTSLQIFYYWRTLTKISEGNKKCFAMARLPVSAIHLITDVHLLLGTSRSTFYILAQVYRNCFKTSLFSKTLLLSQKKDTPFCCQPSLHKPRGTSKNNYKQQHNGKVDSNRACLFILGGKQGILS